MGSFEKRVNVVRGLAAGHLIVGGLSARGLALRQLFSESEIA
jgi:hypothetical protein